MCALWNRDGSLAKGVLESTISDFTRSATGERLNFYEYTQVIDALYKDKQLLSFKVVVAYLAPWKSDQNYLNMQKQEKYTDCPECTYHNIDGVNICEMCETPLKRNKDNGEKQQEKSKVNMDIRRMKD